jgi:hypothetical protein
LLANGLGPNVDRDRTRAPRTLENGSDFVVASDVGRVRVEPRTPFAMHRAAWVRDGKKCSLARARVKDFPLSRSRPSISRDGRAGSLTRSRDAPDVIDA